MPDLMILLKKRPVCVWAMTIRSTVKVCIKRRLLSLPVPSTIVLAMTWTLVADPAVFPISGEVVRMAGFAARGEKRKGKGK